MRIHPHVLISNDGRTRVPCEAGWFPVPENRHVAGSRTIELAFARIRSTSPNPGPPLVYLEGGPGGSGLSTWASQPDRYLCFLEFGDVIALDQRGVGLSRPNLTGPFRLDLPLDRLVTREEYLAEHLAKAAETAAFWRERGTDLDGYTTEENADDVAELMEALGYDTFRTSGGSYGSHLSLSVIRRHGERVDRSLVYGVEGPDDTYKLPSATDRHLGRLAELAAAAPELDGRVPDLLGLMSRVFERLSKEPAVVDGLVIGEFDVKALTATGMGFHPFLKMLPKLFLAMDSGDFAWWAGHVRKMRTAPVDNLMALVMDCASGATAERLRRIERETSLLDDLMNFPFPHIGQAIGGPDLGDAFRAPVSSAVPALFMNGTLDGRTPETNALAVMKGFSDSHLILAENAAHQTVHNMPEVFDAIRDFMHGRPVTLTDVRLDFTFDPAP
ncbi:alpha/beta fold hydrolase [Streptosporangium lutulentum]|uniref:Pimeloyl-ACP methyl ester carboxylesterase n=1 Tax=Streptosporangium lutulentum TaxID=1461250 RepID=A0ABT9QLN1_9ACTN|nr:alpha/beta fold hydrolase [Streptosporangium lutulentum]MDP9847673.1 pimeloyl-ACP methyl ester carboxylesterase [Streptosporangium lutulentum]